MVFVADDLAAWLIGLLADAGRKKLTKLVLGTDQERALRSVAVAAVRLTAEELRPDDAEQAAQLALVISQVFSEPLPGVRFSGQATLLEALQAGIADQLAVLDDATLTGTGQSSAEALEVPGTVMAAKLTGYLLHEIASRGARGGPLTPLAAQLNQDMTHLQGQRLEIMLGKLAEGVRETLARLDDSQLVAAWKRPNAADQQMLGVSAVPVSAAVRSRAHLHGGWSRQFHRPGLAGGRGRPVYG